MDDSVTERPARPMAIAGHPIYSILLPIPVVCFIGALLTDIAYLQSGGNLIWLAFSSWFLLFGLVFGLIAAILLLIDVIRGTALRRGAGLAHLGAFYAGLLVELLNILIHERDGWTAVAGSGLILSIIGVVLMLAAGWLHRSVAERP